MSEYLLPATTYVSPSRLARKNTLNTIVEDKVGENEEERGNTCKRRSGRGHFLGTELPDRANSTSPVPSLTSSISSYYHTRESSDFDDLYDVSDDDSDISPSIMSNTISIRSAASNDAVIDKPVKNRCPSLIIPSPSFWPTIQKAQLALPPRPPKIPLSPAALSMLGQDLPGPSNPPSLVSSLGSDPFISGSAPITPDVHVHSSGRDLWGQTEKSHDTQDASHKKPCRPVISIRTDEATISPVGTIYSPEDRISVRDFAASPCMYRSDSPVLGSESGQSDFGVALPPEALETLQYLSLEPPQTPDSSIDDERTNTEMQQTTYTRRPSSTSETPISQLSEYSMSGLSIPSPGGFFASLDVNSRHTWHAPVSVPASALPPSSTTAENFYSCPWNSRPSAPVEQVVEVDDDDDTEGPPTAKQQPFSAVTDIQDGVKASGSPRFAADEIFDIHDEEYEKTIQESAEKALDRTSTWLAAQHSYLAALRETNPVNDLGFEAEQNLKRMSTHKKNDSLGSPMRKAVKFLEEETSRPKSHRELPDRNPDAAIFYEAFKHVKAECRRSDAFRHRHTRSDSLQSIRICLPHQYISNVHGDFNLIEIDRPHTHRPISMFPGKDQGTPETTSEQEVIARVQRERQALEQVNTRMWVVEAMRYLNGGHLINSPAQSHLCKPLALGDLSNNRVFSPARILDLAGQTNGDWAWHVAREFPHSRIYTATPTSSQPTIRGPRNHKHQTVPNLWTLPYPDNYFRIISARSLFAHLKTERHSSNSDYSGGLAPDEYDLCLKECLRCLKPGGYLEFFTIDSEILNAGSRGTAVSVEFAFNLKTRGYDPSPTKPFLGRLRRAGFDDIKRAWTILPMGAPTRGEKTLPETPPPNVSCFDLSNDGKGVEAVQGPVGSTWDAGELTSLVGAWTWEGWMLQLQEEMGRKKEGLLEGVGAVLEEGRGAGSGWRCLSGWARKPCNTRTAV